MSPIAGQLAFDYVFVDDLSDLDLDHARRVLAEQETTAAPRACRCVTGPLIFRPLPGDGATCSLCGRPAAT